VIIIAVLSVSFAIFFAMNTLLAERNSAESDQLHRIGSSGAPIDFDEDTATVWERLGRPLAAGTASRLGALLPARLERHFDEQLATAGRPVSTNAFTMTLLLMPVTLVVLMVFLMQGSGPVSVVKLLLIAVGSAALGVAAPIVWLNGRISRRQKSLSRELPDTFDLIVVSVEAGLSLEAAVARVVDGEDTPLVEELRRVLGDINVGIGRRRALQGLAARTRTSGIRALVSAILQADQTGMAIGQVLRVQADQLRMQRRQHAEEVAMKAPLKMLFPLVFFIFPALFVVVLGPAVLSLMKTLGSGS
jgi:tight adherence protein C